MRSGTVCARVESCLPSSLTAPSQRFASVQLLNSHTLYFAVEPKSKTKDLYQQTCAYLCAQGMLDTQLFGLAIELDGEFLFVDPDYKLSKYAPKSWRSSSTHGLDSNGKPLLTFQLRVQFYVESPLLLRDEYSRHLYYLQLRKNVISRGTLHASASEEIIFLLTGLALQADFGDFSEIQHTGQYFQLSDYFPPHMLSNGSEPRLFQTATNLHRHNCSLSKESAENEFIREASSASNCPLTHNSHLYHLKQKKNDPNPGTVSLAISTTGIKLYEDSPTKPVSGNFLWGNIGKLGFDRKKFEIRGSNPGPSAGEKLVYYTSSDEKSKHLLMLCKVTHQFLMAIQPRLTEIQQKEEEERKKSQDWNTMGKRDTCERSDQRISVISSTSSNTTSGIVSDRVHSLDESEDDLELEIMINTPPVASVESLALAHLRDNLNSCESSPSPCLASTQDTVSDEVSEPPFSNTKHFTPTSSALTDGSQCSSSCSTVVVASPVSMREDLPTPNRRRPSTSSSLELGFSHTAENSVVSDFTSCMELDYSVQSAHTSSGIYTLRSSCETNTVANTTIACSSETSGICHTSVGDSEGQRSRSGSIVSASGSFHGDGSDPSDAGRGALLSAEELSDLIVGRSPKPRRGVYPSRATVSSTLDSDSDYVTLPPPPLPPPRSDSINAMDYSLRSRCLSSPSNTMLTYHSDRIEGSLSQLSLCSSNRKVNGFDEPVFPGHTMHVPQQPIATPQSPSYQKTAPSYLLPNPTSIAPPLVQRPHYLPVTSNSQISSYPGTPLTLSQEFSHSQPSMDQNHFVPKYWQQYSPLSSIPSPPESTSARFITSKPHINLMAAHTMVSTNPPSNYTVSPTYHPVSSPSDRISQQQRNIPIDAASRMKIKHDAFHSNLIPIVGSNNYLDVRGSGAAYLQQIHQANPPPPPPPRSSLATVYTSQVTRSQIEQFKQQLYSDVDYVIYPMQDPAISKQEYIDSKLLRHYNQMYAPPPYPSYRSYSGKSRVIYRSTPNVAVASSYIPVSFSNSIVGPGQKFASNQNLVEYGYPGSTYSYLSSHPSSTSPLYSAAASYSSSSQSLCYDPLSYHLSVPKVPVLPAGFNRTRSDDNILNCVYEESLLPTPEKPRIRRPPPPPPYDIQVNSSTDLPASKSFAVSAPPVANQKPINNPISPGSSVVSTLLKTAAEETNKVNPSVSSNVGNSADELTTINGRRKESGNGMLDIRTLREKSRNLDLPLISALCNDKSLLKQTNAFVLPKHPSKKLKKNDKRPVSWHVDSNGDKATAPVIDKSGEISPSKKNSLFASFLSGKSMSNGSTSNSPSLKHSLSHSGMSNSKLKYPVSGLSTNQIFKPSKKAGASRHTHPADKSTSGESVKTTSIVSKSAKISHSKSATNISTNGIKKEKSQETIVT
nr:PREDICTED: protein expanded [Bemisia tabaci]